MKTREEMLASDAPYGWEVDVECCEVMVYIPGSERNQVKQFHWVGTEANARRKGMMKTHARAIIKAKAYTYKQWLAAFGEGRL